MTDLPDQVLTRTMKALSLWQPWASLAALGFKLHETRHWFVGHTGPLAIHAAKTIDYAGAPAALCHAALGADWWDTCPRGAMVGVVVAGPCQKAEAVFPLLTRADRAAGNFTAGRFALPMTQARALRMPIPAVGRQGLFNWTPPEDLDEQLGPPADHDAICAAIGWGRAL